MSVSLLLGVVYLISELLLIYSTSSRQAPTRRSRSRNGTKQDHGITPTFPSRQILAMNGGCSCIAMDSTFESTSQENFCNLLGS